MGISPKRFGGWEPIETTIYTYDRRDRVVKTVTTREVEWDDDQQALMLALAEYRVLTCQGCGSDLTETMKIENEFAYTATGPWLCWGCETVGQARARYMETHPKVSRPDRWNIEKR